MFTISLIGQKGGVGKTTIALGLAVAATRAGHATMVVDLDPQASAAKWMSRRVDENPIVVSADASRLKPIINTSRTSGVDFVFIDTAGRKDDSALSAARASDLVLIPTDASRGQRFVKARRQSSRVCSLELHSSICWSPRPNQHVPDDQASVRLARVSGPCLPAFRLCGGSHVGAITARTRPGRESGRRTESVVRFYVRSREYPKGSSDFKHFKSARGGTGPPI
jgi:CobQ/CobB/MinD/ParA nucleotide binding domain